MPRKYHRPPAAKRRKRKTVTYQFPVAPEPEAGAAPELDTAVAELEYEPEEEAAAGPSHAAGGRHITKDYSYVRAEVLRILLIAGFLMASLVVTAILRR